MISKTDMNVKVISVNSGEENDVVVTTKDDTGDHEWIVQTYNGRYRYSDGCLLFVDDEEFDYSYQGQEWESVYENHKAIVIEAAESHKS